MVIVLWTLLNIGLGVGFLVISCYAIRLIRIKYGLVIAVIFSFGLISFVAGPGRHDNNKGSTSPGITLDESQGRLRTADITLEKNLYTQIEMTLRWAETDSTVTVLPNSAFVNQTGLVGGLQWETSDITILPTRNKDEYSYEVEGTRSWFLLALQAFSQTKHYKGIINLRTESN